jgi:O-antigen ligase
MTWLRHQGSGPSPSDGGLSVLGVAVFLLVHVPLGIAARDHSFVSTIHALTVLLLGVGLALKGYERCVAAWAAYLVGVEVFWRMTAASVPWEFGKYAFVLVVGLAILRSGRFRGAALPGAYAALLAPSALLVIWEAEPWVARNQISFNLSGPLSLAVGAWFFSRLVLPKRDIPLVLVALGSPTLCILSDAASSMLGSASLTFRLVSNFEASGGYGPNQVSSMLGLGALCLLLLFATTRAPAWFNGVVLALCLALLTQAALTYSRGGVYTTAAAAVSGAFYLMRQGGMRKRLLIGGALAVAVALVAVVPWLERLTEGTIASRFADVNVTGRDLLVKADLLTWEQNPLLGVGPGMAKANRAILWRTTAAHTEWSRLLAEHGVLGLGAIFCLLEMARRALSAHRSVLEKALSAVLLVWAFLFMSHAAMRLAAPAFAIALAQCRWSDEKPREECSATAGDRLDQGNES